MRLILIGASGHGKVCSEVAATEERYDEIFFLDDNKELKECAGYKVTGAVKDYVVYLDEDTEFFVSIGNNRIRKRIQEEIEDVGGQIATLVHDRATVSRSITLGAGTVVMPGAVINPGTAIGRGVIINTSSSVDHDCTVGDYAHIAVGAHLSGTVHIGDECWIGAGAVVSNNLRICDAAVVGAGAVVVRNIEEPGNYIGVPARKKEKRE